MPISEINTATVISAKQNSGVTKGGGRREGQLQQARGRKTASPRISYYLAISKHKNEHDKV